MKKYILGKEALCMHWKKCVCLLLILTLTLCPVAVRGENLVTEQGCVSMDAPYAREGYEDFPLEAKAAFVYDIESDTVLYSHNPDGQVYPASTTKLLTALVALDMGSPEDQLVMTQTALNAVSEDATSAWLRLGHTYTLEEVLYGMLLPSGNDAAALIAQHYGGSSAGFAELMNEKAKQLGCTGSNFVNPHGLHDSDHYTTARDLAKILLACSQNEYLMNILATPCYRMSSTWVWNSSNMFISDHVMTTLLDDRVLGGKTGYTSAAGRCLAVVSQSGSMKLLSVVMGAPRDGIWYSGMFTHFTETQRLMDHLYDTYAPITLVQFGEATQALLADDGKTPIATVCAADISAVLPKNITQGQLLRTFTSATDLVLPIEAGQVVGQMQIWYNGHCVGQADLLSEFTLMPPTEPPTQPPTEAPTEAPTEMPTEPGMEAEKKTVSWVWMIPVAAAVLAAGSIETLLQKRKKDNARL